MPTYWRCPWPNTPPFGILTNLPNKRDSSCFSIVDNGQWGTRLSGYTGNLGKKQTKETRRERCRCLFLWAAHRRVAVAAGWLCPGSGWNSSPLWNSSEIPFRRKCHRSLPSTPGVTFQFWGWTVPLKCVVARRGGEELFHLWGTTTAEGAEPKLSPAGLSLKPLKRASKVSIHLTNYHQVNTNLQDKKGRKKRNPNPLSPPLLPNFHKHRPVNKLLIISFIARPRSDKCQSMSGAAAWWQTLIEVRVDEAAGRWRRRVEAQLTEEDEMIEMLFTSPEVHRGKCWSIGIKLKWSYMDKGKKNEHKHASS